MEHDTPPDPADEIGPPDVEEMAELERLIDIEVAESDRELDAMIRPDAVLESYLGPDAEPKALDDFADEMFGELEDGDDVEWHGPPALWRDDVDHMTDQLEARVTMMEDPGTEPELLPDEPRYFGKATAAWAFENNTVTLNPCKQDGTGVDTDTTFTIYCTLPTSNVPPYINVAIGDVVAYVPFYDLVNSRKSGVLLGVAQVPEIPDKTKNYGLVYDTSDDSVKWAEAQAFACPEP